MAKIVHCSLLKHGNIKCMHTLYILVSNIKVSEDHVCASNKSWN